MATAAHRKWSAVEGVTGVSYCTDQGSSQSRALGAHDTCFPSSWTWREGGCRAMATVVSSSRAESEQPCSVADDVPHWRCCCMSTSGVTWSCPLPRASQASGWRMMPDAARHPVAHVFLAVGSACWACLHRERRKVPSGAL